MPRKWRRVSPPEVVSGLRSRMGVGGCSCGKLAEAAGSSRESGKNDIKPGKMQAGWRAGCEGGRRGRQLPGLRIQREGWWSFPAGLRTWTSALLPSVLAPPVFTEGLLCAKAESQSLGRPCWLLELTLPGGKVRAARENNLLDRGVTGKGGHQGRR